MSDFDIKLSFSTIRIAILALLAAAVYSVIVLQLWNVQIRSGEEHREKVSKQYARKIRIPAVRGRIISSDMKTLADNRPSYNVQFHLSEMRQPGRRSKTVSYILDQASRLAEAIGRKSALTEADIYAHMNVYPGIPMTVFMDLDEKELGRASEMSPEIDGMEVAAVPVREYPEGSLAANVIGYVGSDDPKLADDRNDYFYYIPDIVGKSGVEKAYDDYIRGSPGKKLVIVNHKGFVHEVVGNPSPAEPGHDLRLTLDSRAQALAERALSGRVGAVVLLDANSGAVIAMATSPSYNPSEFIPKISRSDWARLNGDPRRPLLNRPAVGEYTPGSIVKPIVSMALLENGLSPAFQVECDGYVSIGNARVKCASWRSGGHGPLNIEHAIEQSCNVFFIQNGLHLGMDKIREEMKSAGLGSHTGFPLGDGDGLLPSREIKERLYKTKWNEFDTGLLSIGQGMITVTPLQAALYAGAIANGGILWRPYILKEAKDVNGNIIYREKPAENGRLAVSPANLDIVRHGMRLSVSSSKGSSKAANISKIALSGKTGTAEMGPKNERYTNTWFIGFGQAADGRLFSIAVFVEHGESGGRTCAPIAAKIFQDWLP